MSKLTESYRALGLKQGASLSDIKRAHRQLVRKWHPDKFRSAGEQATANKRISEINAAYTFLTKLKKRNQRYKKTGPSTYQGNSKRSNTSQRENTVNSNFHSYSSSHRTTNTGRDFHSGTTNHRNSADSKHHNNNSEKTDSQHSAHAEMEFDWLNRVQQRMMSGVHKRTLRKKRRKFSSENLKKLLKEQQNWKKLKKQYEERTRIGMYRSLFNTLVFGKILSDDSNAENPSTSLGSFSVSQKYETDLRHHLIQDNIFYATNKGWNIFLKFIFGAVFLLEFIYLLANYFLFNLFSSPVSFVATEMGILILFAIVFLPDNLFQRYLLWKYRDLSRSDIQKTFSNRTLPPPWKRRKQKLLSVKYAIAITFTYLYHEFVFIPLVFG